MTEVANESQRTPGIVIFVAVLNFLSSILFFLFTALSLAVLVFGNIMGIYEFVQSRISHFYTAPANFSLGVNVLFGIFLAVSVFFLFFFVLVGIGLLRGKKIAWYFQVALSVMGLLGFPFGTLLNVVILIFFFQSSVRDYFKV